MSFQSKLYSLLEEPQKSKGGYYLNLFIYSLIIISISNLVLSSIKDLRDEYFWLFNFVTNVTMPLFILEYIARIYASGNLQKYSSLRGKIRYMFTPFAIIDLISILPYILSGASFNNSFVRGLRLLRVFRLFRMKKSVVFANIMKDIFSSKKEEFIVLLFYTLLIIVLLSFVIFEVEHSAQPDVFSNIPQTLWWAVATLTTVGYGDMYPITSLGKFITAIISILGIGFIAIPGGIFASEFSQAFREVEEKKDTTKNNMSVCPKCKKENIKILDESSIEFASHELTSITKVLHCKECQLNWLE